MTMGMRSALRRTSWSRSKPFHAPRFTSRTSRSGWSWSSCRSALGESDGGLLGRVLGGIREEIRDHLAHVLSVGQDLAALGDRDVDPLPALRDGQLDALDRLIDDRPQLDRPRVDAEAARLDRAGTE